MDLTPELQQRFDAAIAGQHDYQPSDGVRRIIKDKTLVMIVAPAAMGKSFVISHTTASDPRFGQATSFTTRDPRSGDEGNTRTIPRDNEHISILVDLIESGQVVNYAIFPTTGMIYGSDLSSYPADINFLPTQSHSVETLRNTGFGKAVTIGLVAPPETWTAWFNARFPEPTSEKTARLKEALLSISWLLNDNDVRWLINREGEGDAVTRDLITLVHDNHATPNEQAIAYAQQLRTQITQMLQ